MSVSANITYRVYVLKQRPGGSEVLHNTKTNTATFEIAKVAFWQLYKENFDNRHLLMMSKNNKKMYVYRYQSVVGDNNYINENEMLLDGKDGC